MRVVVTGASGCVGRAVTRALIAAGHQVIAAQRRGAEARALFPHAEFRRFDAGSTDDLARVVEGADALVHLAARAHVVPRTRDDVEEMMRVNRDASARIVDAAVAAGARRLVYASSVAVYGSGRTTGDRPLPDSPYGESKLGGEAPFQSADGCVLRLSLVFGSGDRGNVAVLAKQVRLWGGVVVGDGRNVKALVYAPHIGDRIVRLLERAPQDARGAFDVVDYLPTQRELVDAIAGSVGKRPPLGLPILPFQLAGSALDLGMRAIGRAPRWRRRVDKLAETTSFSGRSLDEALGFSVPRSLGAALRETFAEGR